MAKPKIHDWDVPLFSVPTKRRKEAKPKPIRGYSGKATTCHVCILTVAYGLPMKEERLRASSIVIDKDGREWLLCSKHSQRFRDGELSLPFNPTERKNR